MLQAFLIKIGLKMFLEWLKSLWERFVEKQKHIEQGRQEVRDAVAKSEKEKSEKVDKALEELRSTNPVSDADYDWLRNRSNSRN